MRADEQKPRATAASTRMERRENRTNTCISQWRIPEPIAANRALLEEPASDRLATRRNARPADWRCDVHALRRASPERPATEGTFREMRSCEGQHNRAAGPGLRRKLGITNCTRKAGREEGG
eukprot:709390-Pleurochrysis_carterae.AAC.3